MPTMGARPLMRSTAALVLLLLASGTLVRALPRPQATNTAATVSAIPSSSSASTSGSEVEALITDTSDSSTGGSSTIQVYYSLAIGACVAGAFAFILTYLYRRRLRQREAARLAEAGANGYGGYNGQGPGLGQGVQPHMRQHSKPIVLTQEQFDMLPHTTVDGIILAKANPQSKDDSGNQQNSDTQKPDANGDAAKEDTTPEIESCSICLSDIVVGDKVVHLIPCDHPFHADCANRWLTQRSTLCPLCKADMCVGLGLKPSEISNSGGDDSANHREETNVWSGGGGNGQGASAIEMAVISTGPGTAMHTTPG